MDTVYCYRDIPNPEENVLINKFGIKNKQVLRDAETELTVIRIHELEINPLKGHFDLTHLQDIHQYIFQDVYDWAGKLRTVDIEKGNMFCHCEYIPSYSESIFSELKGKHYLKKSENIAADLAYFLCELNALHPFREGNGRSQREFIRELALYNGYRLSYSGISQDEMIEASKKGFLCDYSTMEALIAPRLTKI